MLVEVRGELVGGDGWCCPPIYIYRLRHWCLCNGYTSETSEPIRRTVRGRTEPTNRFSVFSFSVLLIHLHFVSLLFQLFKNIIFCFVCTRNSIKQMNGNFYILIYCISLITIITGPVTTFFAFPFVVFIIYI